MPNKITNKTKKVIESWLESQAIPDEVDIILVANNEPVTMLQLNTITGDYNQYYWRNDDKCKME